MAEIVKVALKNLHANPFRHIDEYPILKEKVDTLKESFEANGIWPGILARPAKSGFEIAFGHHRLVAAKELWGDDRKVPIIVDDFDNDQMLKMMSNENSEDWGSNFYLATMQPIAAVVEAFGAGEIDDMEAVDFSNQSMARYSRVAPSFNKRPVRSKESTQRGRVAQEGDEFAYTPSTVARYLGWIVSGGSASPRVVSAINALELIELGAIKAKELQALGSKHAQGIISGAKLIYEKSLKKAAEDKVVAEENRIKREEKLAVEEASAQRRYDAKVNKIGEEKAKAEAKALQDAKDRIAEEKKQATVDAIEAEKLARKEAAEAATEHFSEQTARVRETNVAAERIIEENKALASQETTTVNERARIGVDLSEKVSVYAEKLSDQSIPPVLINLVDALWDPSNVCPIKDVRNLAKAVAEKYAAFGTLRTQLNGAIKRRTRK